MSRSNPAHAGAAADAYTGDLGSKIDHLELALTAQINEVQVALGALRGLLESFGEHMKGTRGAPKSIVKTVDSTTTESSTVAAKNDRIANKSKYLEHLIDTNIEAVYKSVEAEFPNVRAEINNDKSVKTKDEKIASSKTDSSRAKAEDERRRAVRAALVRVVKNNSPKYWASVEKEFAEYETNYAKSTEGDQLKKDETTPPQTDNDDSAATTAPNDTTVEVKPAATRGAVRGGRGRGRGRGAA